MQLFHLSITKLDDHLEFHWNSRTLFINKTIPITLVLLGFLCLTFSSFGQSIGDYRSAATGEWKDLNTWERFNGVTWVTPTPLFPVVAATASSSKDVTTGTTHTVSLPSGISLGDLLLIFWSDANTSSTAPTLPIGWTQLYSNTVNNRNRITWYKVATGAEGTTLDITAGPERSAHNSYRISAGSYLGSPVAGVPATANSNNPDPPSITPGFIFNDNTLWIAAAHSQGDDNSPTPTAPTNYTDLISGYTSGTGNDHARMLTARRELDAATENPGTFTIGSPEFHAANTVAIPGPATGEGTPSSASGAITILSGHTVTVSSEINADECTIGAGGEIVVNSGQTFTIEDGTGTDLTVNGTLTNAGTITNNGTISFGSGSTYDHDQNGGTVPTATWNANSTCQITGVTDTDPLNTTQNFGHFTWNCPSQTGNRLFQGDFAFSIQGDLNVISTGSGELWFRDDKANVVGGNFTQSGGTLVNRLNGTRSLTVNGDFELSGGTFRNDGNNSPGGVLNLAGDFLQSGGTFNGGNLLNIFFTGSTQTFTKAVIATLSGTVNFTINSGANVNIGTSQMPCEDFTLSAGGTLQTTVNSLVSLGQVVPSGDATTNGTIIANFGSFVPTMGDMITVISGASTYTGTPTISTTSDMHQIDATYASGILSIGSVILPIELIAFEGKVDGQTIRLDWRTATELNNAYMAVERSTDGIKFEEIGRAPGVGTTQEPQEYNYVDKNPFSGINYYRLRQVDFDGTYEYTHVISVKMKKEGSRLSLFPNPTGEEVTLNLTLDYTGEAKLTIYDHLGRQMQTQKLALEGGHFKNTIDLSSLPTGLYIVEIIAEREKIFERLIKE